jgi:hypothetical protein
MFTLHFQHTLIFLFISLALGIPTAMSLPVSQPTNGMSQPHPLQGVSGLVLRLQGNQISAIGSRHKSEPEPISTSVWIFSGRIQSRGTHWLVSEAREHPNLVGCIQSDTRGKFFVDLPPGEYTLFAQYGSKLYLNSFLGDGSYESVQVSNGKITEIRLINTEKATF